MSQPNLFYDYSKRDYLLPAGCKNLIDVLNQPKPPEAAPGWSFYAPPKSDALREVWIPGRISIQELAHHLGLKAFKIIACLMMDLKMFKNVNETLDFDVAAKVALQFGFMAKKMPF
jgi:hypothetical protein